MSVHSLRPILGQPVKKDWRSASTSLCNRMPHNLIDEIQQRIAIPDMSETDKMRFIALLVALRSLRARCLQSISTVFLSTGRTESSEA